MPRRSEIGALLHNFLDTFVSRYSRYEQYWLFGFLVPRLDRLKFDLLKSAPFRGESPPALAARTIAVVRFCELASKAGILHWIREASLEIEVLPGTVTVQVNGINMEAYRLSFLARARTDLGREYTRSREIKVAAHSNAEIPSG